MPQSDFNCQLTYILVTQSTGHVQRLQYRIISYEDSHMLKHRHWNLWMFRKRACNPIVWKCQV